MLGPKFIKCKRKLFSGKLILSLSLSLSVESINSSGAPAPSIHSPEAVRAGRGLEISWCHPCSYREAVGVTQPPRPPLLPLVQDASLFVIIINSNNNNSSHHVIPILWQALSKTLYLYPLTLFPYRPFKVGIITYIFQQRNLRL